MWRMSRTPQLDDGSRSGLLNAEASEMSAFTIVCTELSKRIVNYVVFTLDVLCRLILSAHVHFFLRILSHIPGTRKI
ncbi:hypothetical protein KIN20_032083 [Parelaphostrongylus tenuis]|uniref:Uncharacterized protein n=1 Tax=Parelaphostrongylus tenuis TaxID=148309 RepID=A0AAD5R6G6_PARTN|nr:hypothetical protein KIN20_032083 [Parelaphostrongylus tenuis]